MRNKLKKIRNLLAIVLLIALSSCEKEIYEEALQQKTVRKVSKISFEKFKQETGITDFKIILKVPISTENENSRSSSSLTDFLINYDDILSHISQDNKTSYSFKIIPISFTAEEKEKYNLVFYKENNVWEKSIFLLKEKEIQFPNTKIFEQIQQIYDSRSISSPVDFLACMGIEYTDWHCNGCVSSCDLCSQCCTTTVVFLDCGNSGSNSSGNNGDVGTQNNGGANNGDDNEFSPNIDNSVPILPCLTKEKLAEIFPDASLANRTKLVNYINIYGGYFGIDTKEEICHFLAQAGAETGGFTTLNATEGLNYTTAARLCKVYSDFSLTDPTKTNPTPYLNNPEGLANFVYAGNIGNGNEASGDGWTFRGRGSMQLTGRANYEGYQNYLTSIGLGWWYTSPDNLSDPNGIQSVLSAMWYFKSRVLDKITIDASTTVKSVTSKINPPLKGLAKRKNYFNKAKEKLNC